MSRRKSSQAGKAISFPLSFSYKSLPFFLLYLALRNIGQTCPAYCEGDRVTGVANGCGEGWIRKGNPTTHPRPAAQLRITHQSPLYSCRFTRKSKNEGICSCVRTQSQRTRGVDCSSSPPPPPLSLSRSLLLLLFLAFARYFHLPQDPFETKFLPYKVLFLW